MEQSDDAAPRLSVPYSRGIIAHAKATLPEFSAALPLGENPTQILSDAMEAYISRSSEENKQRRQREIAKLVGAIGINKTRRFVGVPNEISKLVRPMLLIYAEVVRERAEQNAAAFAEQSNPYVKIDEYIMGMALQTPPRITQRTAKGLLLGLGLAVATSHPEAANAVALQARQMVAARLISARPEGNERRKATPNDEPFPQELQEGVMFLEQLIGCRSNGARLGYRPLDEPELFDSIVQLEVATGIHGNALQKETRVAAEAYVARRVGYALDRLL